MALGPAAFHLQAFFAVNPLSLPVWLGGLWFFLASAPGRTFRALGWAWVFSAVVIVLLSPRVYYLFPAFLWRHGGYSGESVIVTASRTISSVASIPSLQPVTWATPMPYEHFDVYYCRGLKSPLAAIWPEVKHWR